MTYEGLTYRRELLIGGIGVVVGFAMLSRRDGIMPVLSGFVSSRFNAVADLTCCDHFGMNRPWDFERFPATDIDVWNLVEIGPRHPCSAPGLRDMPGWFGHSRVVSEDFKTSPIDWSSRIFIICPSAATSHGIIP